MCNADRFAYGQEQMRFPEQEARNEHYFLKVGDIFLMASFEYQM